MIEKYFEEIQDKRQSGKEHYNMLEIIIMTICAVVGGCEIWEDIEDFCRVKESWFREKLGLKLENGVASHDPFHRIFAMIEPEELEHSFNSWIQAVAEKTDGEVVSIDGKTIRGSRGQNNQVIHMVSAWANQNQLVLGQVRTEEKSNEITAIPELLKLVAIKGCIVTIDAMGCHKDIAKAIRAKEADYVLAVKGNQGNLEKDIQLYFESALKEKHFSDEVIKTETTRDKGHGRIERRNYYLTTDIQWLPDKEKWQDIKAIGMVHSHVEEDGKIHEEDRYYITSIEDVKDFAHAVRSHWGIENSLHWCLDMVFHEDASRMRKDNSGENFAVIRHIALNLLKAYPAKMSLTRKRHKCQYDQNFLADVLFSSFS